jgi:hypothetical protein
VLSAIQKHVKGVLTQLRLLTAVSCSLGNEMIWRPTRSVGASNNMASATCTMTDADKPKIEELAQEVAFWNRYREARRIEGIDIAQFYADLAAAQKQALTSPGAREDFTELCTDGCFQITLAALVALLRYSPQLESYWAELVGRPDNREQSARNLELAIQTLERIFVDVISSEKQGKYGELVKIGWLPVSRVISELRFYIRFINFAGTLQEDKEIRSPVELTKYLLTSSVHRMTGRPHHRNVSSLIQEVLGLANYDDVAHRMWCNRNYKRIHKHFSWMTHILIVASVVVAETP